MTGHVSAIRVNGWLRSSRAQTAWAIYQQNLKFGRLLAARRDVYEYSLANPRERVEVAINGERFALRDGILEMEQEK